jgi:DNA-directed RNA polymerase subunit RPC12/RpoP
MFEDQTIDVACPKCGHKNSILVREFEKSAETSFVCQTCGAGVKIEAQQFKQRLDELAKEIEDLEREAARDQKRPAKRPRKGDFQI